MTASIQPRQPAVTFSPITEDIKIGTNESSKQNNLKYISSISNDVSQFNTNQQGKRTINFQGITFTGLENVCWDPQSQRFENRITQIAFLSLLQKSQVKALTKSDSSAVSTINDKTLGLNKPNESQMEHEQASNNASSLFQIPQTKDKVNPQDTVCEGGAKTPTAQQSKASTNATPKTYNSLNKHGNAYQGIPLNQKLDAHLGHVGRPTENELKDYALMESEFREFNMDGYNQRSKEYYVLNFFEPENTEK